VPRRVPITGEGVTQKLLAELLNIEPRTVRRLEKEGLSFYHKKGTNERRYPWPESLHWYIKHKQDEVRRRLNSSVRTDEARAAKMEAEAEIMQLELLEKRGQLLTLEHLDRRVDALFAAVRGTMLTFSGKWAPELVNCLSAVEVRERLEVAIADGLQHIEAAVVNAVETSDEEEEPNEATVRDDASDDSDAA